jgi:hypothetical protein
LKTASWVLFKICESHVLCCFSLLKQLSYMLFPGVAGQSCVDLCLKRILTTFQVQLRIRFLWVSAALCLKICTDGHPCRRSQFEGIQHEWLGLPQGARPEMCVIFSSSHHKRINLAIRWRGGSSECCPRCMAFS